MNRLDVALQKKTKDLVVFFTAGDPSLDTTVQLVLEAEKNGATIVELGIPFSDPVAEGEVISRASERSLQNGFKVDDLFYIVREIRKHSNIPLLFMSYINPIYFYGYDKFFKKCNEYLVDGVIIPDIPYEEQNEVKEYTKKHDLRLITLLAPTSDKRIKELASNSEGFIYTVSSLGVTGMRSEINEQIFEVAHSIKQHTNNKVFVGFGIGSKEQVSIYSQYFDGVIVGSAIVKIVEQHGINSIKYVGNFIKSLKEGLN